MGALVVFCGRITVCYGNDCIGGVISTPKYFEHRKCILYQFIIPSVGNKTVLEPIG